ncbi:hypothetical protein V6N12_031579 [Hibiscus sabdariffa]|uniref:Reverse transcriptase Ty1/copia-type domain-containing protein n=1 Tax=Hibiscus sabdariffa TaxID=183260 RepID=A0ABR2DUZ6_9ROSI
MSFLLISRSFHSELLQYNFLPLGPAAFGSAKADQFPADYLKSQINLQQANEHLSPTLQSIKTWLSSCFSMTDLGEAAYILGVKIYRDRSRRLLGLSQSTYIDKVLKRFSMEESKRGFLPMRHGISLSKEMCPSTPQERERMSQLPYASAIGSIMYAMICTQPDLSYALSMTSRYQALDSTSKQKKDDSRSQSGFIFCLNGGAVRWKSSKQDTVAGSTTEAEYIAASEAAKEAVWIKKFITGLGVIPSISDAVDLYCNNNGAIAQAKEPRSHQRSKYILRRFHLIREIIDRGDVEICKVHTDDNIADPLTKPLTQQKHDRHTESLGIRYPPNPLPWYCADFSIPGKRDCAIFSAFGKEFPKFCSPVYSGGLSRDLEEIFVEIQDPSKWFHQENKSCDFLRVFLLGAFFSGIRGTKEFIPRLDDLIEELYKSICS